ncbi:hypothetical protein K505DRAFT_323698 [Melanomma pulvis-pyrius CBS 109.77]|uniref:Peptidase S33 tripeptidyl aminopeptidase-like C-terminal domain-containing protein n=1 Tax=Melanomma pulvis-pyrius CBS 109.77 TaxID=1314802 RepID=A0A6A6XHW2_9PLEO|nr:hypothetical protein K505DRAFT_323698 [Melanomma pulvis-pyrius CBS 109.77]
MDGRYNISTVEKWQSYVKEMESKSQYVGDIWASIITLQCRSLRFAPPKNQVFNGFDFTTTKNPILFTRNRIDPVASSAEKMATFFRGSVVLTQDTVGHGLTAAESDCINKHLHKFMERGDLPPAHTVCGVRRKPFQAATGKMRRALPQRRNIGL